jgi:uncharacterized protein (TIGR02147 family)
MTPHHFVKLYFVRKIKNNPAYSMRAFARDMNWSPSFLSQVLSGKKHIPPARTHRISRVLDMDLEASDQLEKLIISQTLQNKGLDSGRVNRQNKKSRFTEFTPIKKNLSYLLRQWYNIVILDLTTCENFQPDPDWISKRLGISKSQSEKAIKTLLPEGLLTGTEKGFTKTNLKLRFPASENVLKDVREYHRQMILKALCTLQKTQSKDLQCRLINGITVATNPTQIRKAQSRLNEVMHEISDILGNGPCTEVYQLNVQLFSIT